MLGVGCGIDGTDYGMAGCLGDLARSPALVFIPFCPEDSGIGTPRGMPDIHGGDGFDVLDGHAKVLDDRGNDMTDAMLSGARAMLACALANDVEVAILTDMSAACGTQVISDGCRLRPDRAYRRGVGVAAALLIRHGIHVTSQRDAKTLESIRRLVDDHHVVDPTKVDHHETDWYRAYFEV